MLADLKAPGRPLFDTDPSGNTDPNTTELTVGTVVSTTIAEPAVATVDLLPTLSTATSFNVYEPSLPGIVAFPLDPATNVVAAPAAPSAFTTGAVLFVVVVGSFSLASELLVRWLGARAGCDDV